MSTHRAQGAKSDSKLYIKAGPSALVKLRLSMKIRSLIHSFNITD